MSEYSRQMTSRNNQMSVMNIQNEEGEDINGSIPSFVNQHSNLSLPAIEFKIKPTIVSIGDGLQTKSCDETKRTRTVNENTNDIGDMIEDGNMCMYDNPNGPYNNLILNTDSKRSDIL